MQAIQHSWSVEDLESREEVIGDRYGEVGRSQITKSSVGIGLQVGKTGGQETILETSYSNPGER